MSHNKGELRKKYKQLRQNEKDKNKESSIVEKLLNSSFYINAETVLVYSSVGSEIDTLPIIQGVLASDKTLALPVCLDENGHMEFYTVKDENSFKKGAFSIPEPDTGKCKRTEINSQTLCIVPGLAFDRNGYRLGYGKGYYDRFLSNFKGLSLGLCYSSCLCEQLPFDEFDCKIDIIITEYDIFSVNKEEYING